MISQVTQANPPFSDVGERTDIKNINNKKWLFVNSWGEKNLTRTKKAGKVRSKSVTERSEVALLLYGAAVFVGEHKEYSIAKAFEIMQAIGIAL